MGKFGVPTFVWELFGEEENDRFLWGSLGDLFEQRPPASRALEKVRRTLDRRVLAWAMGGPMYRRMLWFVVAMLGHPLSWWSLLSTPEESKTQDEDTDALKTVWERLECTRATEAEVDDHPELLGDLRGALTKMHAGNWQRIPGELLVVLDREICPTRQRGESGYGPMD